MKFDNLEKKHTIGTRIKTICKKLVGKLDMVMLRYSTQEYIVAVLNYELTEHKHHLCTFSATVTHQISYKFEAFNIVIFGAIILAI